MYSEQSFDYSSALMEELEEAQPGQEQESGTCGAVMLSVGGTSQLWNDMQTD